MPKTRIKLQDLIEQVQLDFSESEPSQAYYECEEQHRAIEGDSTIWRLVEKAIAKAVTSQNFPHLCKSGSFRNYER